MRSIPEIVKANAPAPAGTAAALLLMAHTWRYGNAGGAIVCDCPPGCTKTGGRMEALDGGHLVCESMDRALAEEIIAAVKARQEDPEADRDRLLGREVPR